MKKNKILFAFGTRPEAIKMAPIIKAFKSEKSFETIVIVSSQHKEMLKQMLKIFELTPDLDLDLMKHNQTLSYLTANILTKMEDSLTRIQPDLIFVQGDTTTAMTSALAAFYHKIPIAHIEAGLRSYNKYSPFPEEKNRVIVSQLADLHFAPTNLAVKNLERENIDNNCIYQVGNSVVDSLFFMRDKVEKNIAFYQKKYSFISNKKIILVTGHRRENFGKGIENLCLSLLELSQKDVQIIYPVHLNPNVQKEVYSRLKGKNNIHLLSPVPYDEIIYLMNLSYFVITDSGGIQEEAPSLGKPVLVTRNETERPEGVEAGTLKIVGTSKEKLLKEALELLENPVIYDAMSKTQNPYGDGNTSPRIVKITKEFFENISEQN